jgi:hypothetical protein
MRTASMSMLAWMFAEGPERFFEATCCWTLVSCDFMLRGAIISLLIGLQDYLLRG